jgi:hypothetical protein
MLWNNGKQEKVGETLNRRQAKSCVVGTGDSEDQAGSGAAAGAAQMKIGASDWGV